MNRFCYEDTDTLRGTSFVTLRHGAYNAMRDEHANGPDRGRLHDIVKPSPLQRLCRSFPSRAFSGCTGSQAAAIVTYYTAMSFGDRFRHLPATRERGPVRFRPRLSLSVSDGKSPATNPRLTCCGFAELNRRFDAGRFSGSDMNRQRRYRQLKMIFRIRNHPCRYKSCGIDCRPLYSVSITHRKTPPFSPVFKRNRLQGSGFALYLGLVFMDDPPPELVNL